MVEVEGVVGGGGTHSHIPAPAATHIPTSIPSILHNPPHIPASSTVQVVGNNEINGAQKHAPASSIQTSPGVSHKPSQAGAAAELQEDGGVVQLHVINVSSGVQILSSSHKPRQAGAAVAELQEGSRGSSRSKHIFPIQIPEHSDGSQSGGGFGIEAAVTVVVEVVEGVVVVEGWELVVVEGVVEEEPVA